MQKQIKRSALMPYTAEQMYEVVNNVDSYPEFLPWCAGTEVVDETDDSVKATIKMKMGKLNHSFTTLNRLVPGQSILLQLVDGPFKKLQGHWIFTEIGEGKSKIELELDFEFSSRLVSMLIGPVFTQIANSLVDAFCKRAHQLYKKA